MSVTERFERMVAEFEKHGGTPREIMTTAELVNEYEAEVLSRNSKDFLCKGVPVRWHIDVPPRTAYVQ